MRLPTTSIKKACEGGGLRVVWNPNGADGRGKEMASVDAIILHDTVTTKKWTNDAVWNLLTNGRPKLPGPLCQFSVDRDGVIWIVADGRGNHNGYGDYGNNSIGIEVQCAGGLKGYEEPWNAKQYDTVLRLVRVLRRWYNVPVLGHKESDEGRKIDPFGVDLNRFRHDLNVAAVPQLEEDIMASKAELVQAVNDALAPIKESLKGGLRAGILDAFVVRDIPVANPGVESAGARIERIAREIETGKRSWDNFISSLDRIASS